MTTDPIMPSLRTDEAIARAFHETYERLAPSFDYSTRTSSAKPWSMVPANNKALMVATVHEIRELLGGGTAMSDQPTETRHYIGVTPLGRLHVTLGPGKPAAFELPPAEPMRMEGGNLAYPVSAEIAEEFMRDDEGDAPEPVTFDIEHPDPEPDTGATVTDVAGEPQR